MTYTEHGRLSREKVLALLEELAASPLSVSLYLAAGASDADIEKSLAGLPLFRAAPPEVSRAIRSSRTGAVLFSGAGRDILVLPPFPVKQSTLTSGYDAAPLRLMLEQEPVIALILVRLGAYALGVFRGQVLLSSKTGTGNIHARHKKGGSSQHRFERVRDKQMEYFFTRICEHARQHMEPYLPELEHLFYGGERQTLLAFRKQCDFLSRLGDRVCPRLLNVREPRQATLRAAIHEAWSSTVVQWQVQTGPDA